MDNKLYNKLTTSAKNTFEDIRDEFTILLLEEANRIASAKKTADKEISLSDLLEAKEILFKRKGQVHESKQKKYTQLLSVSGAVYSILGILFYLIQNNNFNLKNDLGLLIAATGILVSIIAFYIGQLNKNKIVMQEIEISKVNPEFEIVRRWQVIEKLSTNIMLKEGLPVNQAKSFSTILEFLSRNILDNHHLPKLKNLLTMRNHIVHNGAVISESEIENALKMADEIIDILELRLKKYDNN